MPPLPPFQLHLHAAQLSEHPLHLRLPEPTVTDARHCLQLMIMDEMTVTGSETTTEIAVGATTKATDTCPYDNDRHSRTDHRDSWNRDDHRPQIRERSRDMSGQRSSSRDRPSYRDNQHPSRDSRTRTPDKAAPIQFPPSPAGTFSRLTSPVSQYCICSHSARLTYRARPPIPTINMA